MPTMTEKEAISRATKLAMRISQEYSQAAQELEEKLKRHMEQFAVEDKRERKRLANGEITQKQYNMWRWEQMFTGKQWTELKDHLAEDLSNVARIAMGMVLEELPSAYAAGHNYAAYEIEHGTGINLSFDLYDHKTVERLIKMHPETRLLPKPRVNYPKEKRWDRQKIQSAVMQGILQGESIPEIAARMHKVATMSETQALRAARTSITGAQNAGRVDSYQHAKEKGIDLRQEWLATLDNRTRDAHRHLDGEKIEVGGKFSNGCRYPGDPEGPPREVYNCRCTLVAAIDGVDQSDAPRNSKLKGMTYEEWKNEHKPKPAPKPKPKRKNAQNPPDKFTRVETRASRQLENAKVEYHEVRKLPKPETEEETIAAIAGGDLTAGSCASAALAYAGRKTNGWDVRDFRDGWSREYFSSKANKQALFDDIGANVIVEDSAKTSVTNAVRLLKRLEEGKEYYVGAGQHAAIVRIKDGKPQYLELQAPYDEYNRWWNFSDNPKYDFIDRFGCSPSSARVFPWATAVDISELRGDAFRTALGYVNTPEGKQKKGRSGNLR